MGKEPRAMGKIEAVLSLLPKPDFAWHFVVIGFVFVIQPIQNFHFIVSLQGLGICLCRKVLPEVISCLNTSFQLLSHNYSIIQEDSRMILLDFDSGNGL